MKQRFFKLNSRYRVESQLGTLLAWICNVTHDVLGEHPMTIYINSIS